MGWIKCDHTFGGRYAVFHVGLKNALMEKCVFGVLEANQNDPDKLEAAVLDLIHQFRPEIDGCVLFAVNFNNSTMQWELSVEHGSLPRHRPGERINSRPLDPAYERDLEASKQP